MEQNIGRDSAKSGKFMAVTSMGEDEKHKSEEVEVMVKHQSNISRKLQDYESVCKRYQRARIEIVQKCLREEAKGICNLSDYGVESFQCQIMFDCFTTSPATSLTSISLKNNRIEPFCCHSISSFMEKSKTVKKIILEGCKIGDDGASILSTGIATSASIIHFNVADCNISDDGGEALLKSFLINNMCEDLNLSSNSLSLKSAEVIEEVLIRNKSLQRLDLSHNSLYEDYGIVRVLNGLARNETIEYLDLSWNALCGEPFGKALSKSIKSSKLKVLKIENNRMATTELKQLAAGLKNSTTIEKVYAAGNFIFDGADVHLVSAFTSKSPLKLMSFGNWFHLSRNAFKIVQSAQLSKPIEVVFKDVILPNPPRDVSLLDVYADRAKFLAMSAKKKALRKDFGTFMVKLKNLPSANLPKSDFLKMLKDFKAKSNGDLMEQYIGACSDKHKRIDVHLMANHYLNRHPYTP